MSTPAELLKSGLAHMRDGQVNKGERLILAAFEKLEEDLRWYQDADFNNEGPPSRDHIYQVGERVISRDGFRFGTAVTKVMGYPGGAVVQVEWDGGGATTEDVDNLKPNYCECGCGGIQINDPDDEYAGCLEQK